MVQFIEVMPSTSLTAVSRAAFSCVSLKAALGSSQSVCDLMAVYSIIAFARMKIIRYDVLIIFLPFDLSVQEM